MMGKNIKVSVVSYLNSKPYGFGLKNSGIIKDIDLSFDVPSECAAKLESGRADIGLVPVAALFGNKNLQIIGSHCISAEKKVRTVVLASEVPVEEAETILLDYQSRSSVLLTKVLAQFFWKKQFRWGNTSADFEKNRIKGKTAGVVIGDRVFGIENKYPYIYDLCEEWLRFTGLPFVFAVWAANKPVGQDFLARFEAALDFGIGNISQFIAEEKNLYPGVDMNSYFTENIKFDLTGKKREAIKLFFELARKIKNLSPEK
jgi:chorismate dehydratase